MAYRAHNCCHRLNFVLLQIRVSTATSSSPLLECLRRFLEITFIVVILYAVVKILPSSSSSSSPSSSAQATAASMASRQLSTLMINMQRTFAETVASIIVDPEIRKLIVLWGVCILPTIAGVIGRFRSSSYFTGTTAATNKADDDDDDKEGDGGEEEEEEALLWIAGLGMAWVNTAIGFILPTSPSARTSAAVLWMQASLFFVIMLLPC